MPVADLGDVSIHYELGGDPHAPRLVYVGGSGSDLRDSPGPFDTSLVDHFSLLAYDHRGLGRSTPGPQPPTMADFAADLLGLLDHVGWDRCAMVGISFGGMVAQEAAVTEPSRFTKVVLACTSPGGAGGASYPLHELSDLSPEDRRERWLDVLDHRNTDPARREFVRSVLIERDAARAEHRGTTELTDGERAQLEARRYHDTWDRLPAMTMPVLVAAGKHDGIAPPDNQEALAARLPNATLDWFDGGHAFFLEDRTTYPRITDFLLR